MSRHVFNPSQKRLLALDGGGILGVISLGALKKIEADLREATGKPSLVLADYFDYIAGTSTGAIMAAGLALGKTVSEIEDIYVREGDEIFDRKSLLAYSYDRLRSKFDHKKLATRLKQEFSSLTIAQLQDEGVLRQGKHLLVVTRNAETDSPWPISTNPGAKYNDRGRPDCNLRIPLWQLVRASTAAPTFFAPERLQWDPADPDKQFYFEDGGVTPYNNPASLLFRMATAPEYNCRWETGEDKLMMISVGTSFNYRVLHDHQKGGESLVQTAKSIPSELMRGFVMENDINCRTMGRCVAGIHLDRELNTMAPESANKTQKQFVYARYDIETSAEALERMGLPDIDPDELAMDNVAAVPAMQRIGQKLGEMVDMKAHFPGFLT